jgi:hypothetical protein
MRRSHLPVGAPVAGDLRAHRRFGNRQVRARPQYGGFGSRVDDLGDHPLPESDATKAKPPAAVVPSLLPAETCERRPFLREADDPFFSTRE